MELPHDLNQPLVMAKKFRSPAPNEKDGAVILRLDSRKAHLAFNQIPGLFNVGVPARAKIMNHRIQQLLPGRGNHWLISGLSEPVLRIKYFEGLPGVVCHNQNFFGHSMLDLFNWEKAFSAPHGLGWARSQSTTFSENCDEVLALNNVGPCELPLIVQSSTA